VHHYPFHVGDYASHTQHLDELEDLAYRRMLDYVYLNEINLPESIEEVARLIRMRTHSERIAIVLREFFKLENGEWVNKRALLEIGKYHEKSDKAKESASKRWKKDHANALPTHSERNANQNQNQNQNQNHINSLSITISPDQIIPADIISKSSEDACVSDQFAAGCVIGFKAHNDGKEFTGEQLAASLTKWIDREWRFRGDR